MLCQSHIKKALKIHGEKPSNKSKKDSAMSVRSRLACSPCNVVKRDDAKKSRRSNKRSNLNVRRSLARSSVSKRLECLNRRNNDSRISWFSASKKSSASGPPKPNCLKRMRTTRASQSSVVTSTKLRLKRISLLGKFYSALPSKLLF